MKKVLLVMSLLFCSLAVFSGNAKAAEKKSGKYSYEVLDEQKKTAAITHVDKPSATVKIPKKIEGYTVVQIGRMERVINDSSEGESEDEPECIFSENDTGKVKQIKLPDTLRNIGKAALYECEKLKKIDFPKKLRCIGDYAMKSCCKIKKVVLPKEVESVGSYAFFGCTALEKVVLKTNKAELGRYAFSGKSHWKKIDMPVTYKGRISDGAFSAYRGETFTWGNFTAENGSFFKGVGRLKKIKIHKKAKDVEILKNCLVTCCKQLEIVVPQNVKRVYIGQQRRNIKQVTIHGMKTVLEGDYLMETDGTHTMISVETVKCRKKSMAWKLAKKFICPDFTNVKWENFTDWDAVFTESNIGTKPVRLVKIS